MADTDEEAKWRSEYDTLAEEEVRKIAEAHRTPSAERAFATKYLGEKAIARGKADAERRINEGVIARWTRVLGKFTIVLAVASGISAVIAGLTALILYWTDETSKLRDRAFVYFGDPPITPYPRPPDDPILWGMGITVSDAGNMPARRLTIRYACPDDAISDAVSDTFRLATQWRMAQIGSVIGPKQEVVSQACEIPIDVIDAAKKSLRRVFYLVEVKYLDGFNLSQERITQMSRELRFDKWGSRSLGFTPSHNCSDDDCPK